MYVDRNGVETFDEMINGGGVVLVRALDSYNMTQLDSGLSTPQGVGVRAFSMDEKTKATRKRTVPGPGVHCGSAVLVGRR